MMAFQSPKIADGAYIVTFSFLFSIQMRQMISHDAYFVFYDEVAKALVPFSLSIF